MRASTLTTLLCSLPSAFSAPSQPPLTNTSALPLHFGLLLYPGFVALDAYSVVDILNTLSLEYSLAATFDVIAETETPVSTIPRASNSTFGQAVVVTATYEEYSASEKPLDVLVVPGGYDSRSAIPAAAPFIKVVYPRLQYVLTVCMGSFITAESGILDGRNATVSKVNWKNKMARARKEVHWQTPARWVTHGNIWTASGSASGIDMVLAWIGHVYGKPVADYLGYEYEFNRAKNATDDPFAEIWQS
ncbi:class I glutamine amidotransferase-like protein [Massariosphaeria phaeospora]|uniref:Class I glutamine amidotransferase-like protein n=1 Tax=Massariosphaeria phaeospora TaxID=100035 RepID=A0A7C8M189_9PLEO|nr:class I glutamine amidotransferase-like protein [Massariosphaeria phaeospora]